MIFGVPQPLGLQSDNNNEAAEQVPGDDGLLLIGEGVYTARDA